MLISPDIKKVGDIVSHPIHGERRIIRKDKHVYPIVLEGLVGIRFKDKELTLIKRKC